MMSTIRLWFCVLVALCSFGLHAPAQADLLVAGLSNAIYRYDENTSDFLSSFGTGSGNVFTTPLYFAFGADLNLCVSRFSLNQIERYNPATGVLIDNFAQGGDLDYAIEVTFGPDGNLYVGSRTMILWCDWMGIPARR